MLLANAHGIHVRPTTDILLQQKHGALLGRILRRNGNRAFLKLEEEMFLSLELDGAVIATGGSAIYSEAGMAHMKRTGPCVFLNVPYELIASRLGNLRQRGVVLPNGYTLRDLYDERLPLYRKFADITVDLDKTRVAGRRRKSGIRSDSRALS